MRKRLLIDAGPLIALFDKSDRYHQSAVSCVKKLEEIPVTTWPVITEVCHMLDFHIKAQVGFLQWLSYGGVEVFQVNSGDISRITDLIKTYSSVPMDLADASLLVTSEHLKTTRILSVDSDFLIFRNRFQNMLTNEFLH